MWRQGPLPCREVLACEAVKLPHAHEDGHEPEYHRQAPQVLVEHLPRRAVGVPLCGRRNPLSGWNRPPAITVMPRAPCAEILFMSKCWSAMMKPASAMDRPTIWMPLCSLYHIGSPARCLMRAMVAPMGRSTPQLTSMRMP